MAVWTFLDEARSPELVTAGAIVVTGDDDAPAVAEVVDLVAKGSGTVVRLRILPDSIEDYTALVARELVSRTLSEAEHHTQLPRRPIAHPRCFGGQSDTGTPSSL